MEQYLDAKVKRFVQNSHIPKTKTILAHPEKYMEVLPYHKQVILVEVNSSIRRNSLIGEFDLVTSHHHSPITFVDCDFCKSIVSCSSIFTIR